jgi:hypothetical protein
LAAPPPAGDEAAGITVDVTSYESHESVERLDEIHAAREFLESDPDGADEGGGA